MKFYKYKSCYLRSNFSVWWTCFTITVPVNIKFAVPWTVRIFGLARPPCTSSRDFSDEQFQSLKNKSRLKDFIAVVLNEYIIIIKCFPERLPADNALIYKPLTSVSIRDWNESKSYNFFTFVYLKLLFTFEIISQKCLRN